MARSLETKSELTSWSHGFFQTLASLCTSTITCSLPSFVGYSPLSARFDVLSSLYFALSCLTLRSVFLLIAAECLLTSLWYRQSYDLYGQRDRIDMLAIARPTVVMLVTEVINEFRSRWVEEKQANEVQLVLGCWLLALGSWLSLL